MADDTNQLRVRLVTPERTLFEHAASAVELPAKSGYMEVLYGAAPLMAELGAGDVILHGGTDSKTGEAGGPEGTNRYNVSWGFVEVLPDRVTILASDALKPEEIDVTRAQRAIGPRPQDVGRSRRQRRCLHRSPPRHRRSRSQTSLRGGEELNLHTDVRFKRKALPFCAGPFCMELNRASSGRGYPPYNAKALVAACIGSLYLRGAQRSKRVCALNCAKGSSRCNL